MKNQYTGKNADRNAAILDAIGRGSSYGEVAQALGLKRNVVAGVCKRAGVKIEVTPEGRARRNARAAEGLRLRYLRMTQAEREARSAKLTAGQLRKWRRPEAKLWRAAIAAANRKRKRGGLTGGTDVGG